MKCPRANSKGSSLVAAMVLLLFLGIAIMAIVKWSRKDILHSVRQSKSSAAYQLAEAGVDLAVLRIRNSTSTYANLIKTTPVVPTGFNFDVPHTHPSIQNGQFRVAISADPNSNEVTVFSQGRDMQAQETRAIRAVFANRPIPAPLITQGDMEGETRFATHWGPWISYGNIDIQSGNSNRFINRRYPRKFARQLVTPRDTDDLTGVNTDNLEWWTAAADIPEMPTLDMRSLREKALNDDTLNCTGNASSSNCDPGNKGIFVLTNFSSLPDDRVWYWEGDVEIHDPGVRGTLIVRGSLNMQGDDRYVPTDDLDVPKEAWREYAKFDTLTDTDYPGDKGFRMNKSKYDLSNTVSVAGESPDVAPGNDLAVSGFVYVERNATFTDSSDIYGALWVRGQTFWQHSNGSAEVIANDSDRVESAIFFNENLTVPCLNARLVRVSWSEVPPRTW